MIDLAHGREELRKFRKQEAAAQGQASLLEHIPVDAPMDDATITVWNGERFVAYDRWLAVRPVATEDKAERAKHRSDATNAAGAQESEQGNAQEWLW